MENVVEGRDNRDPKRDKVQLRDNRGATCGKMYLRSLIQLGLMDPPFWFSTLESKKATLILLEGTLNIIISEGLITSSELSYMVFTLYSMACNMEGHVKLIDRLSSPSDQLIHCISHLSKEQTLATLNLSCFICIQVHSFTVFNPHFCKKDSCGVKGPSNISTWMYKLDTSQPIYCKLPNYALQWVGSQLDMDAQELESSWELVPICLRDKLGQRTVVVQLVALA